jgi:hypothetical protein
MVIGTELAMHDCLQGHSRKSMSVQDLETKFILVPEDSR